MPVSVVSVAILCIASASAFGFSIVVGVFVLMWCGCCHVSDDEVEDRARTRRQRGGAGDLAISSSSGGLTEEAECKGIPLNSKPPKLTPEQELLRNQALEKYKRRQARQQRRRERQAAREARITARRARHREGSESDDMDGEDEHDGASSVTSRTTLTSAATTVRTASTAAYGRGAYQAPPPGMYTASEQGDDNEDARSSRSGGSRRSSGTAKSRASQGTVATIKSYLRHRQRQRLRRREGQQQIELFNQWAETQMVSSSELSPSSKSSDAASTAASDEQDGAVGGAEGEPRTRRTSGGRTGGTRSGHNRRQRCGTLESSVNDGQMQLQQHHFANDTYHCRPQRSASVASSAPRPPEEVLGNDHVSYPFMAGGGEADRHYHEHEDFRRGFYRRSHPASPNSIGVHAEEFGGAEAAGGGTALVSQTHTPATTNLYVDPQQPQPQPPRRPKRTWKDVEHNLALSGFFNSATNNSFNGLGSPFDNDGEAPAPFHRTSVSERHSPVEAELTH